MNNKKKPTSGWLLIIAIIIIIFSISSCYAKSNEEKEIAAFENQMHKDPSSWSDEEKDRYNDFSNWQDHK